MAKAYLIGGVPRCGKSSIALRAIEKKPMFATSTDSIRLLLRSIYTESDKPALFDATGKFSDEESYRLCLAGKASEIIVFQNKESAVVWQSVKAIIEGFIAEDLDVLVEGVAILPEFVAELECDYSAVFVGNTSPEHGKHMLTYARSGRYDWISTRSDEAILAFAKFTNEFSTFFAREARKHDTKFFDYADLDFEHHIQAVTAELLS